MCPTRANVGSADRRMVIAIVALVVAWGALMVFRTPIRVHWWARQLARTSDPAVRLGCANMLAAHADLAVGPAGKLLDHADPDVRLLVVGILNRAKTRRAEPYLLTAMGDRDRDVRQSAALGLARWRGNEALPALELMLEDGDHQVVCTAIVALQRVGSPRARQLVADKLASGEPLPVLVQAVESVSLMRATQAIPALIDLLGDERAVTTAPAGRRAVLKFLRRNPQKLAHLNLPTTTMSVQEYLTVADEAARALRAITDQSFGFSSKSPPAHRRAAIRAWRQWLSGGQIM
jgi:HEAT repeat protein